MDDHWGIVTPRFTLVFAFAKLGARTSSIMIDIAVDNGGRIVFFGSLTTEKFLSKAQGKAQFASLFWGRAYSRKAAPVPNP